jgi:hypothetical protein
LAAGYQKGDVVFQEEQQEDFFHVTPCHPSKPGQVRHEQKWGMHGTTALRRLGLGNRYHNDVKSFLIWHSTV